MTALGAVGGSGAAHTPRPWIAFPMDPGYGLVYTKIRSAGTGESVAGVYLTPGQKDRHAANARLIAAAPDLADALERLLEAYRHYDDWRTYPHKEAVEQASAALRAAGRGTG